MPPWGYISWIISLLPSKQWKKEGWVLKIYIYSTICLFNDNNGILLK